MGRIITEWTAQADALLLGRTTYEIFAAHWPHVPDDDPVGAVVNRVPKYVASTTLRTVEWNNSKLLQGDVPTAVGAVKDARSGEIQVHGSCGLLQTLIEHDLVDGYRLWTFPVLLGNGKRLFNGGTIPAGLELIDSTTSSTGVVINRYRRAGDIRYGTFEVDERGESRRSGPRGTSSESRPWTPIEAGRRATSARALRHLGWRSVAIVRTAPPWHGETGERSVQPLRLDDHSPLSPRGGGRESNPPDRECIAS